MELIEESIQVQIEDEYDNSEDIIFGKRKNSMQYIIFLLLSYFNELLISVFFTLFFSSPFLLIIPIYRNEIYLLNETNSFFISIGIGFFATLIAYSVILREEFNRYNKIYIISDDIIHKATDVIGNNRYNSIYNIEMGEIKNIKFSDNEVSFVTTNSSDKSNFSIKLSDEKEVEELQDFIYNI